MIEIKTRGKIVKAPGCVDELDEQQYLYLLTLLLVSSTGDVDSEYVKIRLLSFLAGLGDMDFTMLEKPYADELEAQKDLLSGFYRKDGDREHLNLCTPTNKLKSYRIGETTYSGPGDWLNGITFGEFTECTAVMTNDYEHLTRVLYHIPEDVEVPALLALHSLILFQAVWSKIVSEPIEINGEMIDFGIIFKATGPKKPDDHTGWAGITFEVASGGVFGNMKETEASDMWNVLLYLYKCKFEAMHEKH